MGFVTSGGSRLAPEKPGVCLSTDGGKFFYRSELPGLDDGDDASGMTCVSSDRCFVFSDKGYSGTHDFIFYTNNAQKGVASTWTAAKLPTMREKSVFNAIFFAPDGINGWAVGAVENISPLLLSTKDGGQTWKDSSASVRSVAPEAQLHSGYAFDANNVWLGGNHDTLLTTTK